MRPSRHRNGRCGANAPVDCLFRRLAIAFASRDRLAAREKARRMLSDYVERQEDRQSRRSVGGLTGLTDGTDPGAGSEPAP